MNIVNGGQGQTGKTGKDGRPGEPGEQVRKWTLDPPGGLVWLTVQLMLTFCCRASMVNPDHQAILGSGDSQ